MAKEITFESVSITRDPMGNGIDMWIGEDAVIVFNRKEAIAFAKAILEMNAKRK